MKRNIKKGLLLWKKDSERTTLLLRGARQVGKTYSLRELGKTFAYFVEVNFEENTDIHHFFKDALDPGTICGKLSAYFSTPIIPGETLLFFDEIQACPDALSSLRFFHEKMPELHVAAAGSLLEFAIAEIPSMGVGRIGSLFMYPLSFNEYLEAIGEAALIDIVVQADAAHPIDEPFHRKLVEHVRNYQLIGGMPAVVKSYSGNRDLMRCFKILDDIIITMEDDFSKYKRRAPVSRLIEVFRSAAFQAGGKFKYSNIDSKSSSGPLKDALDLLLKAGLVYRVMHTDARGLPLGAQVDHRKFKIIMFDIGIHQRLLGLNIPGYLTSKDLDLVNKGSLAEVLTGLELVSNHSPHLRPALYYWHREAKGSNAEVDYVIQQETNIVPVEVKSGQRGQMQSIRLFMDERGLKRGIRASLENFSKYERFETVPLYAISSLWANPIKP